MVWAFLKGLLHQRINIYQHCPGSQVLPRWIRLLFRVGFLGRVNMHRIKEHMNFCFIVFWEPQSPLIYCVSLKLVDFSWSLILSTELRLLTPLPYVQTALSWKAHGPDRPRGVVLEHVYMYLCVPLCVFVCLPECLCSTSMSLCPPAIMSVCVFLCVSVYVSVCLCVHLCRMLWLAIWMHLFRFSGEGNGNPLQCSCLENPRDRGAWWAAVYGVAQSQTRLKRLGSSSSSRDVLGRLIFSPPLVPDSPHPWQYVSPDVSHICMLCAMPFPATCLFLVSSFFFLCSLLSADPSILWFFFSSFLVGCRCCTLLPGTRPSLATPTPSDLSIQICWPDFWWRKKICVCTHDACEYIVCFPSWD